MRIPFLRKTASLLAVRLIQTLIFVKVLEQISKNSRQGFEPDFSVNSPGSDSEDASIHQGSPDVSEKLAAVRVISEVDPEGRTVLYGYNLAGQRLSLTDGANRMWRWEFDRLGRVTAEIDPLGNATRSRYDAVGNRTALINARNQTTNYTFNLMNRLSQVSYPDGTVATMTYDLEGRELIRSGAAGSVVKTWDSVSNMTSETFGPWGKKWLYNFDLAQNRISATNPEGKIFKYRFDALDRMVSLDPPEKSDVIKYSFDAAGRLILEERPGVKTTNTFDLAGRLLSLKHERLSGKHKTVAARSYTYSPVGNRLSMQDENGLTTKYSYNNSDWLTFVQYPDGQRVSYAYNGAGDREAETIETPTAKKVGKKIILGTDTLQVQFAYDSAGRMTARASETYQYDNDGNLTTAIEGGVTTNNTWSSDNRLTRVSKELPCEKHWFFRCKKCQTMTQSEIYSYIPGSWKRIGKTATVTVNGKVKDSDTYFSVYDGDDESTEYVLKTYKEKRDHDFECKCGGHRKTHLKLNREFIGGPGTDDLVATKFHGRTLEMLKDGLGSTIALTNRGGVAVSRVNYDAWGNLRFPDKPGHGLAPCREMDLDSLLDRLEGKFTFGDDHDGWWFGRHHSKNLNPYLFAGRRYDSFSGLYFNRNRYYQPKTGRFSSRDPIGFARDINLYRYAMDNPVIHTDPTGKGIVIPVAIGVAVVGLWTTACANAAIENAKLNYSDDPKNPSYRCDYDKRRHFFTSCYFNRCMLNLWPQATFVGGLLWEAAGGDRSMEDVKANVKGIISAYTFGKDCKDCVIGEFGP